MVLFAAIVACGQRVDALVRVHFGAESLREECGILVGVMVQTMPNGRLQNMSDENNGKTVD